MFFPSASVVALSLLSLSGSIADAAPLRIRRSRTDGVNVAAKGVAAREIGWGNLPASTPKTMQKRKKGSSKRASKKFSPKAKRAAAVPSIAGTKDASNEDPDTLFPQLDYADFQISDGKAGNAQELANAVFVKPLAAFDPSTIPSAVIDNMEAMREAAEDAETAQFDPAIDAAGEDSTEGKALGVGKVMNKVLKLTGELIVNQLKQAAEGEDTSTEIAETTTKLQKDVAEDKEAAGQTAKGITAGTANAAVAVSNSTASTTSASSGSDSKGTTTINAAAAAVPSIAGTQDASNEDPDTLFPQLDYADFQISDGTAGNAQALANKVFVTPLAKFDPSTIPSAVIDNMEAMREAAEDAETAQFDPAIDAAGEDSAEGKALSAGKAANKVLKLTGELIVNQLKQAAEGEDTSTEIAETTTKLQKDVAEDKEAAGQTMKGVA